MRIADRGRHPARQNAAVEFKGCDQRAFDVQMRVDKSRNEDAPRNVDLALPRIGAKDADDRITADRHIGLDQVATPDIPTPVTKALAADDRFLWAYHVEIENRGARTLQLMTRHWRITDGDGRLQEVKGDGVVGQQPTALLLEREAERNGGGRPGGHLRRCGRGGEVAALAKAGSRAMAMWQTGVSKGSILKEVPAAFSLARLSLQ